MSILESHSILTSPPSPAHRQSPGPHRGLVKPAQCPGAASKTCPCQPGAWGIGRCWVVAEVALVAENQLASLNTPPTSEPPAKLLRRPTEASGSPMPRGQPSERCFPAWYTRPTSSEVQRVPVPAACSDLLRTAQPDITHLGTLLARRYRICLLPAGNSRIPTCRKECLFSLHACRLPGPDMNQRTPVLSRQPRRGVTEGRCYRGRAGEAERRFRARSMLRKTSVWGGGGRRVTWEMFHARLLRGGVRCHFLCPLLFVAA